MSSFGSVNGFIPCKIEHVRCGLMLVEVSGLWLIPAAVCALIGKFDVVEPGVIA